MPTESHSYATKGQKTVSALVYGRGLKVPKTVPLGNVTVRDLGQYDVPGFMMSGVLTKDDFAPDGAASYWLEYFPGVDGVEYGYHEIGPLHASLSFSYSNNVKYYGYIPTVFLNMGFGTSETWYIPSGVFAHGLWCELLIYVSYLWRDQKEWAIPNARFVVCAGHRAGGGATVYARYERFWPEIEMTREGDNWSADVNMAGAFSFGWTGDQIEGGYSCTNKKLYVTAPEGWTLTAPDPFVEDIPNETPMYIDSPKAVFIYGGYAGEGVGAQNWQIDWACTWPGYNLIAEY